MQALILNATMTVDTSKLVRIIGIEVTGMWLLILEAGVALFLLVFIVWWTMFSGKKPPQQSHQKQPLPPNDDTPK